MDLRDLMQRFDDINELRVIEGADWELEIGALSYVVANKPNPPALLFDNIKGYKQGYRILTLPSSTEKRINLILGLPLELEGLGLIRGLRDKLSMPVEPVPPREVKDGPLMQNVYQEDDVDLYMFPAPKWNELDGGRYIGTGDTVIIKDPEEGWVNIGAHRIEMHDKCTATIFFEAGKHGDIIRKKYWEKGQSCPVAVTLGGNPLYVSVGGTRLPWGMSEYGYMGWWQGKPVEVIKGPVTGLPIPAHSEIALEGEMVPLEVESKMEGPFSEWTGHYAKGRMESAFKVKSILHRDNPILLGYLPFLGPGVIYSWYHHLSAARLWDHLDRIVPGVKGVWTHLEFGGSHAVAISIEQKYGGHAKQVALAALGQHSYNRKFVIVVDDDVDPTNLSEVIWAVGMRSSPESWDIVRDCWCGVLDPLLSPEKIESGDLTHSAVMILACKPYSWIKDFPPRLKLSSELEESVKTKWPDL